MRYFETPQESKHYRRKRHYSEESVLDDPLVATIESQDNPYIDSISHVKRGGRNYQVRAKKSQFNDYEATEEPPAF